MRAPGLRSALIAALMLCAAPLWAQSYQNGGPQPGDQGIGVLPPAQGSGAAIPQAGAAGQTGGGSVEQNAINQAVESALQSAAQATGQQTEQQSGQATGQGTAQGTGAQAGAGSTPGTGLESVGQGAAGQPGAQGGAQAGNSPYSGQGGFVSDSTGLGHVGDSSTPAAPAVQTGPRMETVKVTQAPGGVVRWLDKVSGQTVDIPLKDGQSQTEGRLTIKLTQCRYPVEDPSSNAYAYLIIHDSQVKAPIFQGWMIASSPALDPLDSPRYDVWLLRCTTS